MSTATACLCFDFDAVSVWLHSYHATDSPTKHSRGTYGADVAAPRLLDLLDRQDVVGTWFTPGHTIESFPAVCREVVERGHDVQNHGWTHTNPAEYESAAAERADVERAVDALESLTGKGPEGYRSPSWDFSEHTLDILQDLGFAWDSSLMGHDFEPYYLHEGWAAAPDAPYERGDETDVLEFPVSWFRDDWPPLQYVPESEHVGAAARAADVFGDWRAQFDWMVEHVDGGVFTLTMHPQVVGQPPRLDHLETLIDHVHATPDAEFRLLNEVAAEWRDG